MEDEPRRKRLKLSLTKTKKTRSSHESSVGAAIDDETAIHVAAVVCGEGSATTEAASELNEDADSDGTHSQFVPMTESGSRTAAAVVEEHREAYYSANFKSILTTVLSDSPERHVISEDGSKVVERFMALPGIVTIILENFRGVQFLQIGDLYHIVGLIFTDKSNAIQYVNYGD
jgi:hypothetical protein